MGSLSLLSSTPLYQGRQSVERDQYEYAHEVYIQIIIVHFLHLTIFHW